MTTPTELDDNPKSRSSVFFRNISGMLSQRKIIVGLVVIFILLVAIICVIVFLGNTSAKYKHDDPFVDPLFFRNINSSINPCADFHHFTCGLWETHLNITSFTKISEFDLLKQDVIKKRKNIFLNSKPNSEFPTVVNEALKFYSYCTDLKRDSKSDMEYLLSIFNDIGGWPMLDNSNWNESNFDLIKASLYLQKNLDIATYFEISVTVNDHDSSSNVIFIQTPFWNDDDDLSLENYFANLFLYSVLETINPDYDVDNFEEDAQNLLVAKTSWEKLFSNFEVTVPVQMTFNELKIRIPEFDWLKYIKDFLNDTDIKLTGNTMLMIENIDYLEKVISLMTSNTLTKRQIANFFGWLVVKNSLILIPDVFKSYSENSGYDELEMETLCEDTCFEKTLELYECSIDYLYVQSNSEKGVRDSKIIVKYLKDALKNLFSTSKWLDNSTKYAAIRKLNALKTILGYKDYHKSKAEFEKLYQDFPRANKNIFQTYFMIKAFHVQKTKSYFKNEVIDEELPRPITHVSAYYLPHRNLLVIPISLFSPPFYYSNGPNYLNFGALGSVIGHEIMHAFDKLGCRRDEKGSKFNWWTNNSLENFNNQAECFQNQHDSYYSSRDLPLTNLTLNENIADSEGLRIAYTAYKLWVKDNTDESQGSSFEVVYSPDQMFFISYGSVWCSAGQTGPTLQDTHSFPEFRVNSAVSNSDNFELAFNCPKNSDMNPENKCIMW